MSSSSEEYNVPEGFLYTKEHEWVSKDNKNVAVLVGITDYAAKMLHDIVYVVLPSIGSTFKSGDVFGQVESVKTVSDIYVPISGKVLKTNNSLTKTPEVISSSAYADGWLIELEPSNFAAESGKLLDASAYRKFIQELKKSES